MNFLRNELQNRTHVKVVKIGETKEDDFVNSLTVHPFEQASEADFYFQQLQP